jgi:K+-sensing histidine kinase KdpD
MPTEENEINAALNRMKLAVTDNGPGVPEPGRARVREPFYRMNNHKKTDGSGLGLALIKAIAERHGVVLSLQDSALELKASLVFPLEISDGRQPPAKPPRLMVGLTTSPAPRR